MNNIPFSAGLIIPTGVGASIGGFAGDGMTLLPLFASVCDQVITHPNLANAACFQKLPNNVLYVEGYALDRFFCGDWGLIPVRQNKVGVIFDKGIPNDMQQLHYNVIAAVRTTYGINIDEPVLTQEPLNIVIEMQPSGRSAGSVRNMDTLYQAAEICLEHGANCIAVCALMPDVGDDTEVEANYQAGQGIDPIGGIEAMISHALVQRFEIPVAHAPVFPWEVAQPVRDRPIDPRSAAEFIAPTFLPCVLEGLSRAPQYHKPALTGSNLLQQFITIGSMNALVVPYNCLGGVPMFQAYARHIPILVVANNQTVLKAGTTQLGFTENIINCHSYLEALGHLVALKAGLTLPEHIYHSMA